METGETRKSPESLVESGVRQCIANAGNVNGVEKDGKEEPKKEKIGMHDDSRAVLLHFGLNHSFGKAKASN